MNKTTQLLTALLLASATTSAFAQDDQKPEKIVLEQKVGSVMASVGGDYESATVGKLLIENESLMLSEGAKATVAYYYDNVNRKCTELYEGPNTFIIDDSCKKAAYIANNRGSVAIIAGAAIIGGVILDSMDKVPPQPISGGAR